MDVDVGRTTRSARRHVAIHWRVDDRVIDERHTLLAEPIPTPCVLLVWNVKVGIGSQCRQERRLVVRRSAQPTIGDPRPGSDCIACRDLFIDRARCNEVAVREAAPLGGTGQHVRPLAVVCMQRVVQAADHSGGIAERRMLGDLTDALAVDPDFPTIVEAF